MPVLQFSPPWGFEMTVDAHKCDKNAITSAKAIRAFVRDLVKRIDMQSFGKCKVVHFGADDDVSAKAGFSMTQLISTSLISGHFCDATGDAYINIFSCKYFEPGPVLECVNDHFHPDSMRSNLYDRDARP